MPEVIVLVLATCIGWLIFLSEERSTSQNKSMQTARTPSKPQFINSKPNPEAKQSPQSLPPMPQVTFEQIQQEAAIRERGTQRVSPQTANDLYRLVRGDGAMVTRLVEYTKARHPNKSEQWIWEKTIQDLERDRGYR